MGDKLYVSGQIGFSEGLAVSDDPETQFTAAFEHVKAVLAGAGKTMADIVEMTTFHVGLQAHANTFLAVKDKYIDAPYPAWTAIGIEELFVPGALVEIKVIALDASGSASLGSFTLSGIAPNRVGMPQVAPPP